MKAVTSRFRTKWFKTASVLLVAGFLAACQADELGYGPKHLRPVSGGLKAKMERMNLAAESPIMIRIYKEDSELEVWKEAKDGKFKLLDTFEICSWSGELGPKKKEGDRQAPEGFYEITPSLMNPNSNYHLAFNMGYPNKFDRAHGRTGSHLMVHGACSSRGCYAMTDPQIQDIYALARDSFRGGQRSFQVQALPFRMTAENMARFVDNENYDFWKMLKRGSDHFEITKRPPQIAVCDKHYIFDATKLVEGVPFNAVGKCPELDVPDSVERAVLAKEKRDEEKIRQIVASNERAEKRKEAIASIFGGGAQTTESETPETDPASETATATAADAAKAADTAIASATADAKPEAGVVAETVNATPIPATAFAAQEKPAESGFFSRWIPSFGSDDEETATSEPDPALGEAPPPAAKPE
ncbi:transcriptional regulator [Stappia sp. GBMRC 2046]|uniref:Transcriptional regulator n=1 Tax=Stappia sediminis TaxID=2692190 RepID=A0A7X3LTX2_9HYPH|nr:murein L,D-transpeptidase family protein [Stappia sediminis]MXN65032.1 transcriptional regulator [Stappia sediminis]